MERWKDGGQASGADEVCPLGRRGDAQVPMLSSHGAGQGRQRERSVCASTRAGPKLFCFFITDFLSLLQSSLPPKEARKLEERYPILFFFFLLHIDPATAENKPISIT